MIAAPPKAKVHGSTATERLLLLLLVALVPLLSSPRDALAEGNRHLVLVISGQEQLRPLTENAAEILIARLAQEGLESIGPEAVVRDFPDNSALRRCAVDIGCISRAASTIGTDRVLLGMMSEQGEQLAVTLELFDAQQRTSLMRGSVKVERSEMAPRLLELAGRLLHAPPPDSAEPAAGPAAQLDDDGTQSSAPATETAGGELPLIDLTLLLAAGGGGAADLYLGASGSTHPWCNSRMCFGVRVEANAGLLAKEGSSTPRAWLRAGPAAVVYTMRGRLRLDGSVEALYAPGKGSLGAALGGAAGWCITPNLRVGVRPSLNFFALKLDGSTLGGQLETAWTF